MSDSGVSRCAVPHCSQQWYRLGEGKLFLFHVRKPSSIKGEIVRAWLCEECFESWQVLLDSQGRAVIYPAVRANT
jgi:hypothetical protein